MAGVDYTPVIIAGNDVPYPEYVPWFCKRFKRLNGREVKVFSSEDLKAMGAGDTSWSEARLFLWNGLPASVEYMLFMDLDLVQLKPLPDFAPCELAMTAMSSAGAREFKEAYARIARHGVVYNTFLMLARRCTRPTFEIAQRLARRAGLVGGPFSMEGVVNALIVDQHPVRLLPSSLVCYPFVQQAPDSDPCVVHMQRPVPSTDLQVPTRMYQWNVLRTIMQLAPEP